MGKKRKKFFGNRKKIIAFLNTNCHAGLVGTETDTEVIKKVFILAGRKPPENIDSCSREALAGYYGWLGTNRAKKFIARECEQNRVLNRVLHPLFGWGVVTGKTITHTIVRFERCGRQKQIIPNHLYGSEEELAAACQSRIPKSANKISVRNKLKPDFSIDTEDFYKSPEWKRLRIDVLEAYGAKCVICGRSPRDGIIIHVDHIKPLRTHPDLRLKFDNLQPLCNECNEGKGNRYCTDWRPHQKI